MILIIDVESTGSNPENGDELLRLTILDFNEKVIFDHYFKPANHQSWEESMKHNHITPEMVSFEKNFEYYTNEVQDIINEATALVSYNLNFCERIIQQYNISLPNVSEYNLVENFAATYGMKNEKDNSYKTVSLNTCADYYSYESNAKDKLDKAKKILYCFKHMYVDEFYYANVLEATGITISKEDYKNDLREYLDYLFRTDSLKKWQNEDTDNNEFIQYESKGNVIRIYQIKNKFKLRAATRQRIEDYLDEEHVRISRLYKCVMEFPGCHDLTMMDSLMISRVKQSLKSFAKENDILLCLSHFDEYKDGIRVPKVYLLLYKREKLTKGVSIDTINDNER